MYVKKETIFIAKVITISEKAGEKAELLKLLNGFNNKRMEKNLSIILHEPGFEWIIVPERTIMRLS